MPGSDRALQASQALAHRRSAAQELRRKGSETGIAEAFRGRPTAVGSMSSRSIVRQFCPPISLTLAPVRCIFPSSETSGCAGWQASAFEKASPRLGGSRGQALCRQRQIRRTAGVCGRRRLSQRNQDLVRAALDEVGGDWASFVFDKSYDLIGARGLRADREEAARHRPPLRLVGDDLGSRAPGGL